MGFCDGEIGILGGQNLKSEIFHVFFYPELKFCTNLFEEILEFPTEINYVLQNYCA